MDIVFVTSNNLYENKRRHNKNTFYLPNVADAAHFSKALNDEIKMPADMAGIKNPILGFIGAIDDYKLDSGLLEYISDGGWSIVLIGPLGLSDSAKSLKELLRRSNVRYLGQKEYALLPSYLKYFDVCLIPMRISEYTVNVFPMKFFEYLSAGKPVVSIKLPSLRDFAKYAYLAGGKNEFREMIKKALAEDSEKMREMRIAIAKENTWEKRIETMAALIETHVKKMPPSGVI